MRKSGTSGKERKQGLFPSCFPDFQIISCLREEGLLGQANFNLGKSNRISNIQQGTPNIHRIRWIFRVGCWALMSFTYSVQHQQSGPLGARPSRPPR